MTNVVLELETCKPCPNVRTKLTKGYGYALDYRCSIAETEIVSYVEWEKDIPPVPEWCPLKEDKVKTKWIDELDMPAVMKHILEDIIRGSEDPDKSIALFLFMSDGTRELYRTLKWWVEKHKHYTDLGSGYLCCNGCHQAMVSPVPRDHKSSCWVVEAETLLAKYEEERTHEGI